MAVRLRLLPCILLKAGLRGVAKACMASAIAGGFCFAIYQRLRLVWRGYGLLGVCLGWLLCLRLRFKSLQVCLLRQLSRRWARAGACS